MAKTQIIIDLPGSINSIKSEEQKGLLLSKKKSNRARRVQQKSGIRFYDTAFIDGSQLFLTKIIQPITNPTFLDITTAVISSSELQLLFNQIDNFVFSIEHNQFTSRFKKILKSDYLCSDIFVTFEDDHNGPTSGRLDTIEKFQDDLLSLSATEVENLSIRGLFNYYSQSNIILGDIPDNIKVTEVLNVNADPVNFTPGGDMDIFLLPSICLVTGVTEYYGDIKVISSGMDLIKYYDLLNAGYQVLDRTWFQVWLDSLDAPSPYLSMRPSWLKFREYPGAILNRGKEELYESGYAIDYAIISPGSFPNPSFFTETEIITPPGSIPPTIGYSVSSANNILSKLIFIIKKGGKFYYFWDIVD